MTVLIAGAGPAGLTLACFLRAQGVAVRVVDAATGPATTSRALGLHRRGVEVLRRAGALGDLPERAITLSSAVVMVNGKPLSELPFGGEFGPLLISQATIEAQIRDRLTELGTTIDWSTPVTGLDQDGTGVTVTLGEQETARFDWVVGCDGAHSAVRGLAGIDFPGTAIIERFLLADLRMRWEGDRKGTCAWLHRDGMLAMFPLPGSPSDDLWRVFADVPAGADEAAEPTEQQILDGLRGAIRTRAGFEPDIIEPYWTSRFRIHRRLAESYRTGHVLLAGDAAHIHSPFGGQGMNTGIGDAENLAWKLALVTQGRADEALLDSYQAERRPIAKDVVANTTAFTKLALSGNPLVRLARERLLPALLRMPVVRRAGLANASQLGVSYRKGPLGAGRTPRGGPVAGDRVPDLECFDRDGERVRLHDRLGTRWIVLARSHAEAAGFVTAVAKRLDPACVDSLIPATGALPSVYVVRPDGHLAWRGGDTPERLARWLEEALSTGRAR